MASSVASPAPATSLMSSTGLAVVKNVRPSSGEEAASWIKQSIQEYYSKPREQLSYRSSAAWSLRQMDDRFAFLQKDRVVIDLGCFSGGWSQVAVERTHPGSSTSRVIGVDKVKMDPLTDHTFVHGDIEDDATLGKLLAELGDTSRADVVLCDLAPKTVGLKVEDHHASCQLALHGARVVDRALRLGGWFVVRVTYGPESEKFHLYLRTRFEIVTSIRPPASREVYREMFYVCRGFKGRERIAQETQTTSNPNSKREGDDMWSADTQLR